MKKRTVITTEKHEVWVIRQTSDVAEEQNEEVYAGECDELLTMSPNQQSDTDPPDRLED